MVEGFLTQFFKKKTFHDFQEIFSTNIVNLTFQNYIDKNTTCVTDGVCNIEPTHAVVINLIFKIWTDEISATFGANSALPKAF